MKNLTVAISDDIYTKARRKAAEADTSVSKVVADYLRLWVSRADPAMNRKRELKQLFRELDAHNQNKPVKPLSRREIYADRIR